MWIDFLNWSVNVIQLIVSFVRILSKNKHSTSISLPKSIGCISMDSLHRIPRSWPWAITSCLSYFNRWLKAALITSFPFDKNFHRTKRKKNHFWNLLDPFLIKKRSKFMTLISLPRSFVMLICYFYNFIRQRLTRLYLLRDPNLQRRHFSPICSRKTKQMTSQSAAQSLNLKLVWKSVHSCGTGKETRFLHRRRKSCKWRNRWWNHHYN